MCKRRTLHKASLQANTGHLLRFYVCVGWQRRPSDPDSSNKDTLGRIHKWFDQLGPSVDKAVESELVSAIFFQLWISHLGIRLSFNFAFKSSRVLFKVFYSRLLAFWNNISGDKCALLKKMLSIKHTWWFCLSTIPHSHPAVEKETVLHRPPLSARAIVLVTPGTRHTGRSAQIR